MILQPGRELDMIVAKAAGWTNIQMHQVYDPNGIEPIGTPPEWHVLLDAEMNPRWVPTYSTDIAHAWSLVEKYEMMVRPTNDGRWFARCDQTFSITYGSEEWWGGDAFMEKYGQTVGITAPHAICLAVLYYEGADNAD